MNLGGTWKTPILVRGRKIFHSSSGWVPDSHTEVADVGAIEFSLFDDLQVCNEAAAIREIENRNHSLALPQRFGCPCCGAHHPNHHCQRHQQCRNHHHHRRHNRHPSAIPLHHLGLTQLRSLRSAATPTETASLTTTGLEASPHNNMSLPPSPSLWRIEKKEWWDEWMVKELTGNGQGEELGASIWCNPIHYTWRSRPNEWMIAEKRFWVNPLHLKNPETQLKTSFTPFLQIPNSLNQVPDFFPTLT